MLIGVIGFQRRLEELGTLRVAIAMKAEIVHGCLHKYTMSGRTICYQLHKLSKNHNVNATIHDAKRKLQSIPLYSQYWSQTRTVTRCTTHASKGPRPEVKRPLISRLHT